MTKAHVVVAVLAACGGNGERDADWSGIALDDKITANLGNAIFELALPKGWSGELGKDGVRTWRPAGTDPERPTVKVAARSGDIDAAASAMGMTSNMVVVKKPSGDGFTVTAHDPANSSLEVEVLRRRGETSLVCKASLVKARHGSFPAPEAQLAWLEKLCGTLVIR